MGLAREPPAEPRRARRSCTTSTLKRKVAAGADRAITQFFFDNSVYFRFLDVAGAAGLTIPIAPDIFRRRTSSRRLISPAARGTSAPRWLAERFDGR
jgi:methylenetetrahydrofolate reductase (NADPH)